jgi:hypothetical protein
MQQFGACLVTVPIKWTGVCNSSIIIKTCVNCTIVCLFDRVLAPITSTLRPVSLHQPRATSHVRLRHQLRAMCFFQASYFHQAQMYFPGLGCIKCWLRYCLCPTKNSASGGDSTTDNFYWILGADRYCFAAADLHMPKRLEDCLVGASKSCSAMASRSGQ